MRLFGWRVVGGVPDIPQCVVIVAPHTSNWDFPLCIFTMFATGLRLNWYGKHTLFRFPVKSLLHWFGGEPIDRSTAGGHVDAAIARFREGSPWVLGVSPEGTRKLPEQWRLGFYRIAMGASVPVLTVSLDYRARVVTLGQPIAMTGDQALDLAALDARFTREMARYPQQYVGALRA
jgi:1-acyl-sn-glycerol-3-phosphate acyltransferase